jgi:DNA-directed RNA polymerase subunit F
MIHNMEPLNLAEVKELSGDLEEKKDLMDYLKKFGKLTKEKADALTTELKGLDNLKLKKEFLVKIVDFLPRNSESLNKIFIEVSLDEKETQEILDIVKKY